MALCALRLAKLTSAEAIVTSSSDEKLGRAREIGADHTINYKTGDVAEAVKEITAVRGVDVVVYTIGAATGPLDFSVARRGGRIVICGVTSGPVAETNLQSLYWNQLTVIGSTMGSDEDLREVIRASSIAGLRPLVDSVQPLDNIQQAMGTMEKGEQLGKIALRISD